MRDIVFVILFTQMLLMSIRHIHTGTMLWIWTALASPSEHFLSFATSIPFNKLSVVATCVALVIDPNRRSLKIDLHIILLILFTLQGVISFSFGLTDVPRTYDLLDKMCKITILCIMMTIAGRGRIQIHATLLVLCLSVGIQVAPEGLKYVASAGSHVVVGSVTFGDNNYIALAGLMVLPVTIYLYRYSAAKALRFFLIGMLLAILVGVVATASRGGLIGLIVLGLMIIVQRGRKLQALLLVGALSLGVPLIVPATWLDRMHTIQSAEDDASFMSRVVSWKMNTLVALNRPLVGGGYSAMEDPRVFAMYLPQFHSLDFIPTDEPKHTYAAHSVYFEALGDLGFVGIFLFLAILFAGFRNVSRVRALTQGSAPDKWAYDLAGTFRQILIVYMISGAALSATYFEALYVILTVISILRWHIDDQVANANVIPPNEMMHAT